MPERPHDENAPVYVISVASELADVHPQTLRTYEKYNIIKPARSKGNVRMYSIKDIKKTKEAKKVIEKYGVTLAGARLVIELEEEIEMLKEKISELEEKLATS